MPKRIPINFSPINAPYLYGVEARLNARHVEVVRAEAGDWRIFGTISGETIKACPEIAETYPSKAAAIPTARRFLQGRFTPDTWHQAGA